MPPKKEKELTFSLDQFTEKFGSTTNWADAEDDFDDFDDFNNFGTPLNPPTAGSGFGQQSWTSNVSAPALPIPTQPPFSARVSNIPFESDEASIQGFFGQLPTVSIRLPRGEDGRLRGAAYVDFADRDSLVEAIKLSGQNLNGRNLTVAVTEQRNTSSFGKPSFDWSSRATPTPRFQAPRSQPTSRFQASSNMDWSRREQPQPRSQPPSDSHHHQPRHSAPPVSRDWGARQQPQIQSQQQQHPHSNTQNTRRQMRQSSEIPVKAFDWGARNTAGPKPRNTTPQQQPVAPRQEQKNTSVPKVSNPFDLLKEE